MSIPRPLLSALGLLAACVPPRPPLAPPVAATPAAPSPPPPSGPACTLDETDVAFPDALVLQHELPPPGAMVEYFFAEVRRASRLRVELPEGDSEVVPLGVMAETSMLRLRGVSHAASVPLFPARASTFDGLLTPLATRRLRWTRAAPGAVLLSLDAPRRARLRPNPAWRECAYLRLRPPPPFEPEALPPPSLRRPLRLAPGRWSLYVSPGDARGPHAEIDLVASDTVTLLEDSGLRWARVLWVVDDVALVGWIDRRRTPYISFGHGSSSRGAVGWTRRCPRPVSCPEEMALLVDDRGARRAVGHVRAGATVSLGAEEGALTRVTVCDPDVDFPVEAGTFVPTVDAARCMAAAPVR